MQEETYEINGYTLEEGMTVWRYGAVNLFRQKFSDQSPSDVVMYLAKDLARLHPEETDYASVESIHENLMSDSDYYKDKEVILYNSMTVEKVRLWGDTIEISLYDDREGRNFCFGNTYDEYTEDGEYYKFDDLSVLEEHLGVTLFPVE